MDNDLFKAAAIEKCVNLHRVIEHHEFFLSVLGYSKDEIEKFKTEEKKVIAKLTKEYNTLFNILSDDEKDAVKLLLEIGEEEEPKTEKALQAYRLFQQIKGKEDV